MLLVMDDDLRAEVPQKEGRWDTTKIEELTGVKGAWVEKEGVFRVQLPRTDLKVRVGGVKMTPRLGLTAWAAF